MTQVSVVRIPGTRYLCLGQDRSVTPRCLQAGRLDWDRSMLEEPAIAGCLRPGAVVIDVGAFIGDTTQLFLDRGCLVYAIEPRRDAFALLEHNCRAAIAIHRAAGLAGQRVSVSPVLSNADTGSLGSRQMQEDPGSSMLALALDELNPYRCDLIKVDAEGFEPYVLKGAGQLVQRTRPVLHIEVNLPALASQGFKGGEIEEIVQSWSYTIKVRQPERVGSATPWDLVCTPR